MRLDSDAWEQSEMVATLLDRPIDDGLIDRYVETAAAYPHPEDARIGDYGVSVVALITHLRAVDDILQTAAAYDLPIEAVLAAQGYYQRHQERIDARIVLNRAYFE